jgi:hypothetical protein
MPGPQQGAGRLAVADWWLGRAGVLEETEAAATPATTTNKAATRSASFIVGNPSWKLDGGKSLFPNVEILDQDSK